MLSVNNQRCVFHSDHREKTGLIYLQDISLAAFHAGDQLGEDTNGSLRFSLGSRLDNRPTANSMSGLRQDVSTCTGVGFECLQACTVSLLWQSAVEMLVFSPF